MRRTQISVTVFLKCQSKYLFLLRSPERTVDANRLNGIGGKVESGENFLDTALRETQEETGYLVTAEQTRWAGMANLEGGYPVDWITVFFVIEVDSLEIPVGHDTREGQLMWLKPDEVLSSKHELVDDLYLIWPLVIKQQPFFLQATLNDQEKIAKHSLTILPK
jgi:8-oxo-dGTP pyrophosphatase MutT (NUDIX family)